MANIEMPCPHCGRKLSIPDSFAGQKGGCIHCKGRFTVPDAPAADLGLLGDDFAPMSPSALEQMDIDDGGELSPAFAEAAQAASVQAVSAAERLGCFFWGLAFHLPPVALVWALFLPKGHSQKAVGLGVSAGFLLLAIVLMLVFT